MAPTLVRLETESGELVCPSLRVASGVRGRFMGLMGKSELPADEGLLIQKCSQIHMFFMRIPLDVAFVNGDGRVLHALHGIRPWRVSKWVFGSKAAIELPVGTLNSRGVDKGSILRLA